MRSKVRGTWVQFLTERRRRRSCPPSSSRQCRIWFVMRRPTLCLSLAAISLASTAQAQSSSTAAIPSALSPRNANYSIDARLDAASRTISGSEVITWRNITTTAASDLQFHLYWNAWKNPRSTFLRERAFGGPLPGNLSPNDFAQIDVNLVQLRASTQLVPGAIGARPTDLSRSKHLIAPDDGNPDYETVMAVSLPHSIPPGGTVTSEVKWTTHVPRTFARTGAIGNFFFIAQWFPKLGVLQDDGWNCHQFHSSTEFFSDYGVYDVSLTVPQGWTLGATGVQRERRDRADRADRRTTTHRYYQEDVHDFAWTTSPDYIVRTARFDHGTLPAVDMRPLLQPEHENQADRHFDATRVTLKYYGEWFGAYPYGHITIVEPAHQSRAGRMGNATAVTGGAPRAR